jgi:hypothetical protein
VVGGRTRNISLMSVPRPGPSSTIRKGFEPGDIHRPIIQSANTSPNTWLISGLVTKSPRAPKTGCEGFM